MYLCLQKEHKLKFNHTLPEFGIEEFLIKKQKAEKEAMCQEQLVEPEKINKSIKADSIGESQKFNERKLQNEKSKKYVDSLHQDLLDFKRDSAKFPERKMKYKRYGGWKLPTKPMNFKKSNLFFHSLFSTIKVII